MEESRLVGTRKRAEVTEGRGKDSGGGGEGQRAEEKLEKKDKSRQTDYQRQEDEMCRSHVVCVCFPNLFSLHPRCVLHCLKAKRTSSLSG